MLELELDELELNVLELDELLEDELFATELAEDITTGGCSVLPPPPPPHAANNMNIGKTLADLISHLKFIVRILSLYLIFSKPRGAEAIGQIREEIHHQVSIKKKLIYYWLLYQCVKELHEQFGGSEI